MKFLSNGFSINMLEKFENFTLLQVVRVNPSEIPANVYSVVSYSDYARILTEILGFEVSVNRETITLTEDDLLYVALYKRPRLPKGATKFPKDSIFEFFRIATWPEGCSGCDSIYDCEDCTGMDFMCGL